MRTVTQPNIDAVSWNNHYTYSNNRNTLRWAVLGLSQDGAFTALLENLSMNSLKGGLSNATTFNPPLFLLVNTFK